MSEPEHSQAEQAEREHQLPSEAIQLAEGLGYVETAELRQLRLEAVQLTKLADAETARAARASYHVAGQEMVESLPDARAQIGLIVAKGYLARCG
ncbi:MAG TPA: hypothetical protein VK963_00810 [Candidatus Saccharimonadales bacterium]|nr:hypothetical protein [Candidatus Saccharimonadales bacterium]